MPGEDLTESFFMIEATEPAHLKKENKKLKEELEMTQKRLETMDRIVQMRKDRDMQLQESIHIARKHVRISVNYVPSQLTNSRHNELWVLR